MMVSLRGPAEHTAEDATPGELRAVLDGALARLDDFRGRAELDDDLAIVAIEVDLNPSR